MPQKEQNCEALWNVLRQDVQSVEINKRDSYIHAYFEFIEYFKKLSTIEKHHLFIGAHFVYGWMPKMLTLHMQELTQVLEILNKAKKSADLLSEQELEILKECINRSMVGTSKLLHFINPKKYAIWDSRVAEYLRGIGYVLNINSPEDYLSYLNIIDCTAEHEGYKDIHTLVEKKCGYEIEPTRAIEMIMYETERNRHSQQP